MPDRLQFEIANNDSGRVSVGSRGCLRFLDTPRMRAYYYQRTAAVHRIENGAAVTPAVEWLMTASGAHSMQTDPSNRFAFVPHIANRGPNQIYQFKFDENTGHLTPAEGLEGKPAAVP